MVQSDIYPEIKKLQNCIMVPYDIEEVTIDDSVFYQYEVYKNNDISLDISNDYVIETLKLEILNIKKKEKLNAGFDLNGIHYDYDTNARIAYRELADELRDDPTYTTPWKASEGHWVTMDADQYTLVKAAGKAHIESVFAWLSEQI